MFTINITPTASVEQLRETLDVEARRYGMNFKRFVGDIYSFAVYHKSKYQTPLRDPGKPKGQYIGGVVDDLIKTQLDAWATEKKTTRANLCRFILQKTLEDNLLDSIFRPNE